MQKFEWEYTDTFAGEANYSWVKRGTVHMPELTHYGYTGSCDGSYSKADKVQRRELMKRVKRELGLTGVRGITEAYGDMVEWRPYGCPTVLFVWFSEEQ